MQAVRTPGHLRPLTKTRSSIPPSPLRDRVGYSDHDRFRGYFPVHFIPAYNLPVYASQRPLPDATQDSVRGCSLGFAAAVIADGRLQRACKAQLPHHRTYGSVYGGSSGTIEMAVQFDEVWQTELREEGGAIASFMWLAPAFHQGPRPLEADPPCPLRIEPALHQASGAGPRSLPLTPQKRSAICAASSRRVPRTHLWPPPAGSIV
jgi:hypothetical protein